MVWYGLAMVWYGLAEPIPEERLNLELLELPGGQPEQVRIGQSEIS